MLHTPRRTKQTSSRSLVALFDKALQNKANITETHKHTRWVSFSPHTSPLAWWWMTANVFVFKNQNFEFEFDFTLSSPTQVTHPHKLLPLFFSSHSLSHTTLTHSLSLPDKQEHAAAIQNGEDGATDEGKPAWRKWKEAALREAIVGGSGEPKGDYTGVPSSIPFLEFRLLPPPLSIVYLCLFSNIFVLCFPFAVSDPALLCWSSHFLLFLKTKFLAPPSSMY